MIVIPIVFVSGITSNTVIDLKKTNITRLEEDTFRPLLTILLKGTGHVQLHGNTFHVETFNDCNFLPIHCDRDHAIL